MKEIDDPRAKLLWRLVDRRLKIDRPTVVGITGSLAKTSTKEAVGQMYRVRFPGQVRVGFGNLNTYLGVPLAIFGFQLDFYHRPPGRWAWGAILAQAIWRSIFDRLPKYLILELGADRPGDIAAIVGHLPLDIAVITAVGPAHLENYPSIDRIAQEKGQILTALKPSGRGLVGPVDKYWPLYRRLAGRRPLVHVKSPLENISQAISLQIGQEIGLSQDQITETLSNQERPPGRFNLRTIGSYLVLDDSYNANPLSMRAAINKLSELPGSRKVALVGEMRELGPQAARFHRQIGRQLRSVAQLVVGVGELAKHYRPDRWFSSSQELAGELLAILEDGDTILVKGSRAVMMEKIVDAIEQNV